MAVNVLIHLLLLSEGQAGEVCELCGYQGAMDREVLSHC